MTRGATLPQAVGVTALLASGALGVIANRWDGFQSRMAYLPPAACLMIGALALAVHFSRRADGETPNPAPWRRSGVAIFCLGVVTFGLGVGLLVEAVGRRSTLPVHEGVLGVWVAVFGFGVLLFGRFVGRGSL